MFTNTILLLNIFLSMIDFNQDYFHENDFEPIDHEYKGEYIAAIKQQWVTYDGYTFRIHIYCEIETKLDELSKIYFTSNDINENNQKAVLEYLSNISILFSPFISYMFYLSLDNELINKIYKKAIYEFKNKKLRFNSDEYTGAGVISVLLPEDINYLKYRTFFGVVVTEENGIIINYTIDLYNQYYN